MLPVEEFLKWLGTVTGPIKAGQFDAIVDGHTENVSVEQAKALADACTSGETLVARWLSDPADRLKLKTAHDWCIDSVVQPLLNKLDAEIHTFLASLHTAYKHAERFLLNAHDPSTAEGAAEELKNVKDSLDSVVKAVEAGSATGISAQRSEYLIRSVNLAIAALAIFEVDRSAIPKASDFQNFATLKTHISSFGAWVDAATSQFPAMALGWTLSIDLVALRPRIHQKAKALSQVVLSHWDATCTGMATRLKTLSPTKNMVDCPRCLTEAEFRSTFAQRTRVLHDSGAIGEAASLLDAMKTVDTEVPEIKKLPGRVQLMAARRHAKLCIAINWAVGEIVSFAPENPVALVEFSSNMFQKLSSKGFGGKDPRCVAK